MMPWRMQDSYDLGKEDYKNRTVFISGNLDIGITGAFYDREYQGFQAQQHTYRI